MMNDFTAQQCLFLYRSNRKNARQGVCVSVRVSDKGQRCRAELERDGSLQAGSRSVAVQKRAAWRTVRGGIRFQAETAQPRPCWLDFYTLWTLGKNTQHKEALVSLLFDLVLYVSLNTFVALLSDSYLK